MAAKFALIIGNSQYDDSNLSRLQAPDLDVHGLEEVLKAPAIGQFDEVTTLLNESTATVRRAVARFYERRRRDDLLLLYFSGHGVKDDHGRLYLALRDTETALLAGSAIEASFITGRMDHSVSKRQVVMLDCCHSGAFTAGAKAAQGVSVGTAEAFEGSGLGRVVLTATDSTQYAWEGDRIVGDAEASLFTHFVIDGLKTGAADRDEDGVITIDELYDYVHDRVVDTTPRQTPRKWNYRRDGDLVIAQNPLATRAKLPPEIDEAINSKLSSLRLEGVRDLEQLLKGRNVGRRHAALAALKQLAHDDSRMVATAATEALKASAHEWPADAETQVVSAPQEEGHPDGGSASPEVKAAGAAREKPRSIPVARLDPREVLPSDIFISYEHNDRPKAQMLATALTAEGWTVWWDRRIAPGESFDVVIERELASCRCVIVLWTARSVGATWVRNEARRAAKRRVLVPLLMEAVEPPLEFENLQAADLTTWEASAEHAEFEAVLDRILALAPVPARMAKITVQNARREFSAGRRRQALSSLEQFQPADNTLVSQTLAELKAEARRHEAARAEAARQQAEARNEEQRLIAAREQAERVRIAMASRDAEPVERAVPVEPVEIVEPVETTEPVVEAVEPVPPMELGAVAGAVQLPELTTREESAPTELPLKDEHLYEPDDHAPSRVADVAIEAAPLKPTQRRSRTVVVAAVAAVLAVIVIGAWMLNRGRPASPSTVNDPSAQVQPSAGVVTGAAISPLPRGSSTATENPSALPSTAIGGFAPPRAAARENRPSGIASGEPSAATAAARPTAADAAAQARRQRQAGDRVQALDTVVEGLRLFPKDAGLTTILNALLSDAQAAASRWKRNATSIDAQERAAEAFDPAVEKEREAERLRRSGRTADATRAWWAAADQFRTAAGLAREVADEEAAEQARSDAKAKAGAETVTPSRGAPPPAATAAPADGAAEEALVAKMFRQYEGAYARLNADAVRSVFPAAPVEELQREFGRYRSYTLTVKAHVYDLYRAGDLVWMNVPATVVHVVSTKAGETSTVERAQTFQLVKQGATWVIRQVK